MCISNIPKEPCVCCDKPLNIGQSIAECEYCDSVIHSCCFSKSKFVLINEKWACKKCEPKVLCRYNPFNDWVGNENESEKHYNDDCGSDMSKLSSILNSCQSYTIKEFNSTIHDITKSNDKCSFQLSSYFLNIDGVFTNFDQNLVILKGINHTFSAIGLAETNIGPNESAAYIIPGYTAFYQNARDGKQSGTGVAIYIHESLNATIVNELSQCSTDIESIIVKVTNLEKPTYFGTIYRPHDSDKSSFYNHLSTIFETLPKHQTFLMGDFNIDLLQKHIDHDYENSIFTNGYAPSISIYTHDKPGCKKSCIDNILTNSVESIILTGTITDNISHHLPIFHISDTLYSSWDKRNQTRKFIQNSYNKVYFKDYFIATSFLNLR